MAILRPPGPKSHFPLGSFPRGEYDRLALLTGWAREYGDIFHYKLFNLHAYFLNRPDYAEYVLVTHARNFIKGRGLQASRRLLGNGLLTSEGDFWLRQRRLCQPAFHRERIAAYAQNMVASAERMLANWSGGETRNIHRDMMAVTLEIVAQALFSTAVDSQAIAAALDVVVEQTANVVVLLPFFRLLPTRGNLLYRRAIKNLERIVYGLIRERKQNGSRNGDLLSLLLHARDEDGSRMTDRQLRDEVLTIILAGHETTAIALSWAWYLLAQRPEVEEKLLAELRHVLAGRSPTVQDLPSLPYTEAVIKESMRLYPPAWMIVRVATRDCEIGGYHIPAGSSVAVCPWVMHRDARFYDAPERFSPERWLGEAAKQIPKFAYFPFGGGPRFCIGASFAMLEATLLLATIAQRFRFTLVPDHPVVPLPSMTLRPRHGILARVSPRMETRPVS